MECQYFNQNVSQVSKSEVYKYLRCKSMFFFQSASSWTRAGFVVAGSVQPVSKGQRNKS